MKYFAIICIFFGSAFLYADESVLQLNLLNGEKVEIPISEITKIEFDDPSNVEDNSIEFDYQIANYPNPVLESTKFEFYMPQNDVCSLTFFDNNGNIVAKSDDFNAVQGINHFEWKSIDLNGKKISSGVYFLEIKFSNNIINHKFVIVN